MQTDASEERLSKYELIRLLGCGGMGEVYLARDTVLQREVAIKFVSPERLTDREANERLLREARAAATLEHPNICPVYDVLVDRQGRTCVVMQYVEGETLSQRLDRGPLDPAEAMAMGAAVADALAAAHAHGIVHRDLKPQNVMIAADGRPKLLDFGIAHSAVSPDAVSEIATHTATVSWSAGAIVGTPAYMSPEQVLCKPVDGRSDLFALGAVLFECLTGHPAFQAGSDVDTWARVVYVATPLPSSINPRVPAAADAVVMKLLAKDPGERFASAEDAARALRAPAVEAAADGGGRWRRRARLIAAIVAVVMLGGFASWRVLTPRALPPPPPQAKESYDRGVAHLRNGAYASAAMAFTEATAVHPAYPEALARLAEAQSELDEELEANATLVRLSAVLPDTSRLPRGEAQRLDAVRKVVLRDVSGAAADYQRLADANPRDIGVWLDLARVRQLQWMREAARAACVRALQINPGSAPAHLRMGSLAAESLDADTALREFAEAERLYRAGSDKEGEAEALLRRASFLESNGELPKSAVALDAAEKIVAVNHSAFQQVRAMLLRSSLMVSTGALAAGRQKAEEAVDTARDNNLDTVAADALIQVGTALMSQHDAEGEQVLKRAIALAKSHNAFRVATRATLQLAAFYLDNDQPADARALALGVMDFITRNQYTRFELTAKTIIARAEEETDIRHAERLAREVLAKAESLHDGAEEAGALEGLAGPATTLGSLPEALALRQRLEQMHRDQRNTTDLAYDLTNRAELLVRLGRFDEAEEPLRELETGAASGIEVYASRKTRVDLLRAIAAAERRDLNAAATHAAAVLAAYPQGRAPDTIKATAEAIDSYVAAGRRQPLKPWSALRPASVSGELRYWRAMALLAAGRMPEAATTADAGIADLARLPSSEFEWRLCAIGAAAAQRQGDKTRAEAMAARARAALDLVRTAWKADAAAYERRPDLIELKRAAGIS